MKARSNAIALAVTLALGAAPALAGGFFQTTNDEAGSRIVLPAIGAAAATPAPASTALPKGAFSPDRQYVYLGGEGGWQLRPMEYEFDGLTLVHVDDPVGHMNRVADTGPLTPAEKAALARSGGA